MTDMILRLNYENYFNGGETISELIAPIDKFSLFRTASFLINKAKVENGAIETINIWFSNLEIKSDFIKKTNSNASILNVYSSLKFLNYITHKKTMMKS